MIDTVIMRRLCGLAADDLSRDEVIADIVHAARSFAAVYTGEDADSDRLDAAVTRMAVEDFGRLGSGGVVKRGYSNMSESYAAGYSGEVYRLLRGIRRLRLPVSGEGEDGDA